MGASQGVITIVRGAVPLALFGAKGYGAVLGVIATPVLVVNAASPTVFAWIVDRWGWATGRISLLVACSAAWLAMELMSRWYERQRAAAASVDARAAPAPAAAGRSHEGPRAASRNDGWASVNELSTRLATPDDAPAIAAIYNEGIADRIATFETEPRTPEQIARQLVEKGDRFPTIVAEHGGRVVAWAGAGAYRARPAYAGVAEHSVYVARSARGRGAGGAALDALCQAYAERGFWKIVSRIFPENTASLALHERCGFRVVGVYQRHGKLEGEWRDCVVVERLLGEALGPR